MTETIHTDGRAITLTQAIKLAGLSATGGEAKLLIAAGEVSVNGEVELRKRRQLAPGDRIVLTNGSSAVIAP